MRVEDLKRGHWIVIAILLGAALAWAQGFWNRSVTQTQAQVQFENLLFRQPVKAADGTVYPYVANIVVYPPVEAGFTMQGEQGEYVPKRCIVRYGILTPAPDQGGWYYKPAITLVGDPYRPRGRAAETANFTIRDFLNQVSESRDWIKFKYAWWAEPKYSYSMWIGGMVLVLGVIWPTVQNRLVAAGYGRPTEEKEKKPSLFSQLFAREKSTSASSSPEDTERKPASMALSQEDLERIAAMEAELSDFAKGSDRSAGGEGEQREQQTQVRQLNAAPLEAPKVEERPQEEVEYDGEFYPTVAHAKRKRGS